MDSKWAHERRARLRYFFSVLFGGALVVYILVHFYTPPTCFDDKKNQDEVGVDCGGVCEYYCRSQIYAMRTIWAHSFEVSPGWYSTTAFIENPNYDKQVDNLAYRFTVYDSDNNVLASQEGMTFAYHEPTIALVEGRIAIGDSVPYRTTFEWLSAPRWKKIHRVYEVTVEEQRITQKNPGEEITATLRSYEPIPLRDVEVVAIVYDQEANAMASSHTYIDTLQPLSAADVVFVWPRNFPQPVGRVTLLPRIPAQE